jgi:hypothetical protein
LALEVLPGLVQGRSGAREEPLQLVVFLVLLAVEVAALTTAISTGLMVPAVAVAVA